MHIFEKIEIKKIYKCIYMYILTRNFIKNVYVNYLTNIRTFMYIRILKNYMM